MAYSLLDGNATFLASVTASAAVVQPLGVDLLAEFRKEKGWLVFHFLHLSFQSTVLAVLSPPLP